VGDKSLEDFGNYVSLKEGQTTKGEVYERFGQPVDVTYQGVVPSSPSTWTYVKADMHVNGWSYVPYVGVLAGGASEENMTAWFSFDAKGKYAAVKTVKDTSYTNHWVGLTRDVYRRSKDPKAPRVQAEMERIGKPFNKKYAKNFGERRFE
jgi:hypothetical protein